MTTNTAPQQKPNEPSDEGKLVRQLIAAVLLSVLSTIGVGGIAVTRSDVSPEVRALLDEIRISLTKLEGRLNTQDRDFVRLEGRVDKLEAETQALKLKVK